MNWQEISTTAILIIEIIQFIAYAFVSNGMFWWHYNDVWRNNVALWV